MSNSDLEQLAQFHGVDLAPIRDAANDVMASLVKACVKHSPMRGHHEGWAVIHEELDEMWDEVKKDDVPAARKEALHVAAMGMRFLLDVKTNTNRTP